jgi:hypothetical protein
LRALKKHSPEVPVPEGLITPDKAVNVAPAIFIDILGFVNKRNTFQKDHKNVEFLVHNLNIRLLGNHFAGLFYLVKAKAWNQFLPLLRIGNF